MEYFFSPERKMLLCRAPHSGELQEGRGSEHMAGSWGAGSLTYQQATLLLPLRCSNCLVGPVDAQHVGSQARLTRAHPSLRTPLLAGIEWLALYSLPGRETSLSQEALAPCSGEVGELRAGCGCSPALSGQSCGTNGGAHIHVDNIHSAARPHLPTHRLTADARRTARSGCPRRGTPR